MTSRNQTGSLLVVVIVALAVLIVGTVGYFAWGKFNPSNNSQPDTSKTPDDKSPTPEPDPQNDDGYIVLKDWGIRFKKVDALNTTTVKYSVDGDTYAFTTARIEALGGECTKEPYNVTVSLIRTTDPNPGPMNRLNEQPINGYYYMTYGPPASCSSFDGNGQMKEADQIENDDRASLKEMLATISPAS